MSMYEISFNAQSAITQVAVIEHNEPEFTFG